jgi:hypothetical protein
LRGESSNAPVPGRRPLDPRGCVTGALGFPRR